MATEPAFPDPVAEAKVYIEEKAVNEIFQELSMALLYKRPDDPKAFLVSELKRMQRVANEKKIVCSVIFVNIHSLQYSYLLVNSACVIVPLSLVPLSAVYNPSTCSLMPCAFSIYLFLSSLD